MLISASSSGPTRNVVVFIVFSFSTSIMASSKVAYVGYTSCTPRGAWCIALPIQLCGHPSDRTKWRRPCRPPPQSPMTLRTIQTHSGPLGPALHPPDGGCCNFHMRSILFPFFLLLLGQARLFNVITNLVLQRSCNNGAIHSSSQTICYLAIAANFTHFFNFLVHRIVHLV